MKIKSIEAFLAIAQNGSIRAAARHLNLSQPAVSKALKALEEEVGAPLLVRGSKGIDLTIFGQAFLARATIISHESTKIIEEIQQMRGEINGSVSILLSPTAAIQFAPATIRHFRHSYPKVKIKISEGLQASALTKLRMSEIDFAITTTSKSTSLSSKEFEFHPLREIPMVIIARKNHPLKDKTSLLDLLEADWLQITSGDQHSSLINEFYKSQDIAPPISSIECHSFTSSLALIESSDMLGMLPEALIDNSFYSERFEKFNLVEGNAVNKLQLIYRRDIPLTPIAQKLVNYFLRRYAL
ncbi:LysR substrate-binding domain-containing protein [Marinomonas arenicola]|uniref:LysR substrate-binding domain-containing protein n=1 Tax=Marinomonas TaxID=28253 RepID=UPI0010549C00|nr:LysR substrate-binding domain-containing protein [Marinomonas sp. KMM3893]